jgi:hypothetical protein
LFVLYIGIEKKSTAMDIEKLNNSNPDITASQPLQQQQPTSLRSNNMQRPISAAGSAVNNDDAQQSRPQTSRPSNTQHRENSGIIGIYFKHLQYDPDYKCSLVIIV